MIYEAECGRIITKQRFPNLKQYIQCDNSKDCEYRKEWLIFSLDSADRHYFYECKQPFLKKLSSSK